MPTADSWPTRFDPAPLEALQADLAAHGTPAFVVLHQGVIVHERYAFSWRDLVPGPAARRRSIASMAKAVVATTALLLCEAEGLIDLDAPAAKYLAAWRRLPDRREITLRQLATHTSGLANARYPDWTGEPVEEWEQRYWDDPAQRTPLAIKHTPLVAPAGACVAYSNPGYSVLASVLAIRLAETSYGDVVGLLRQRIMDPLDLPPASWSISYGKEFPWRDLHVHAIGGGLR
jgi:CubicO group peptidase (beta-lactamase class C family)